MEKEKIEKINAIGFWHIRQIIPTVLERAVPDDDRVRVCDLPCAYNYDFNFEDESN